MQYHGDSEKRKEYQRKYYQTHKEKAKEYQKEYNLAHKKKKLRGGRHSASTQPRRRLCDAVTAKDIQHCANPTNLINSVLGGSAIYLRALGRA